jgi:N-acetylglutamate synthase-like GNAT family acetyltransferase
VARRSDVEGQIAALTSKECYFRAMDIECHIRAAQDADAAAVSEVILSALRETNAKDYPREVIERLQMSFTPSAVLDLMGRRKVFIATSGQQIVGTASLDQNVVRTVFVAPEVQGHGVGRRLMAEIERNAREAGVTRLVVPSSVSAQRFYAKLGFTAVGDHYYGEERTIIMERDLMSS